MNKILEIKNRNETELKTIIPVHQILWVDMIEISYSKSEYTIYIGDTNITFIEHKSFYSKIKELMEAKLFADSE